MALIQPDKIKVLSLKSGGDRKEPFSSCVRGKDPSTSTGKDTTRNCFKTTPQEIFSIFST